MSETSRVVIIGAGQAGVELADALRAGGFAGRIALVGAEPGLPYERPPLSKDFLLDPADEPALPLLRPEGFYRERGIDLYLDRRAVGVDLGARRVFLDGVTCPGSTPGTGSAPGARNLPGTGDTSGPRNGAPDALDYDELVFATGARNRELAIPGADLDGVFALRDLDEARALRSRLASARRVVVVGAGFVGLEFAAAARARGAEVTVLEFAARPMARVVSVPMSEHFARAHAGLGIDLRLNEGVREIVERSGTSGPRGDGVAGGTSGPDGSRLTVLSSTGAAYPADLVLLAVGIVPEDRLAREAGLDVDDGILVDAQLRTSAPQVSAIGDCARYPSAHAAGGRIRLESVQNATDQGRYLARRLLGPGDAAGSAGEPAHATGVAREPAPAAEPYAELPWFWTHQGPLKLYIAGLVDAADRTVTRGDPASGAFSLFCFREGRLSGVESLNRPADHVAARKILAAGRSITPEQAADPEFDLKAFSRRRPAGS